MPVNEINVHRKHHLYLVSLVCTYLGLQQNLLVMIVMTIFGIYRHHKALCVQGVHLFSLTQPQLKHSVGWLSTSHVLTCFPKIVGWRRSEDILLMQPFCGLTCSAQVKKPSEELPNMFYSRGSRQTEVLVFLLRRRGQSLIGVIQSSFKGRVQRWVDPLSVGSVNISRSEPDLIFLPPPGTS